MWSVLVAVILHQPTQLPIQLGKHELVEESAAIGLLVDVALAPDGSIFVADMANHDVIRFSPEGRLVWRSGREGKGPGEFSVPYRVAPLRDGGVLVYDFGIRELSWLNSDGTYLDRKRFPFDFSAVDKVIALPTGEILVCGVTTWSAGASNGLHLFSADLRHLRSFGDLPAARDRSVLLKWGAGGVTLGTNGEILYTPRIPYTIYRYDSSGEPRGEIRAPFHAEHTVDDAFVRQLSGSTMSTSVSDDGMLIPGSAHDIGSGWLLGTRRLGSNRWFDFFSPSGDLVSSIEAPEGVRYVIGIDWERGVLWARGEASDAPALFRIPISSAPDRVRSGGSPHL